MNTQRLHQQRGSTEVDTQSTCQRQAIADLHTMQMLRG